MGSMPLTKRIASGGSRKVNQPKPDNAISTPRTRGRKVDLKMS
jgi:hypothetical protein